jgi:3-oxoadipate enol-lactonase
MSFVKLGDVAIHYRIRRGKPGTPAVVFSNSLGTDFRIWDALLAELGDAVTSICYDKRGHGLSDIGATPYAMEDHGADLIALAEHAGVARVAICGLSVGGLIAQAVYRMRPELVCGIVLSDTAAKIGSDELWNARLRAIESGGIASIAEPILERWFSAAYRNDANADLAGYRNMLVRTPVAGYCATCVAIRDADYTPDAARIAVPTLCIVGAEDGSTPPQLVKATADLIPGAQFEIIAGAGHLPCIEQPKALARLLRAFLASIPGT